MSAADSEEQDALLNLINDFKNRSNGDKPPKSLPWRMSKHDNPSPLKRKISVSEPNLLNIPPARVRGNSLVSTALQLKGRLQSSRKYRNRLVAKNGYCNISLVNVPKQGLKYCSDIFTTLIEVRWRYILMIYCSLFIFSWFFFSGVIYSILYINDDMSGNNDNEKACISNINSYTSVFIFTFASQTTIGFGFRYPTDNCVHLLVVLCIQNLCGMMLQTLMAGVVFAKLARPKKRAETILFSKNACICMRDGQLVFMFRVGDMRKTQLAEAHVRLQMIKKRVTEEGELIPFHQYDMDVGFDTGLDRIFLVWPITVCHVIDEDSPFYDISQDMMKSGGSARFEVLVLLEGVVESTGATTQARTGYATEEVMWGHRFEKMATYRNHHGSYRIDFDRFHKTYKTEIPPFSAKELDRMKAEGARPLVQYQRSALDEIKEEAEYSGETVKPRGIANKVIHKLSSVLERPRIEDISNCDSYNNIAAALRIAENGDVIGGGEPSPETDDTNLQDSHSAKSFCSENEDIPKDNHLLQPQFSNIPPPKKMSKFRGHDIM